MKRIDKIRQMTSEKLAKAIIRISECQITDYCKACLLLECNACSEPEKLAEWLEEEVQEDG